MLDGLRGILQAVGGFVAVAGGIIAAFKAINEIQLNRQQRQMEFRWKQANAAKELLTDIHHHNLASNATLMLDWHQAKHGYQLPDGSRVVISWEEIVMALSRDQRACQTEVEIFVRDCFDWFFYFIDRIELYIDARLIERSDVEMVFRSYAAIVNEEKGVFWAFMEFHGYGLAMRFFESTQALGAPMGESDAR